jgi:hypothetical protein
MAQQIENLIGGDDTIVFSVVADPAMLGAALTIQGIWYSVSEITQLQAMLERAKQYLINHAGE